MKFATFMTNSGKKVGIVTKENKKTVALKIVWFGKKGRASGVRPYCTCGETVRDRARDNVVIFPEGVTPVVKEG